MKKILLLLTAFMLTTISFAQNQSSTVQLPSKPDRATLERDQKAALDKLKADVTSKMQELKLSKQKADAQVSTAMTTSLNLYIDNTLKFRTIDRSLINQNKPVITEVYCGNPQGIKPFTEFLIIGYNLLASSGTTQVNVTLGTGTLTCNPLYGKSTGERLWVVMADFSGITGPTAGTVSVSANGYTSVPANITLLPELEQKELDLTLMRTQLLSDLRSTSSMILATDITQLSGKHGIIIFYKTVLGIYHDCPYSSNPTTEYRGLDEFFITSRLKNNWVVKSAVYYDNKSVCGPIPENQTSTSFGGLQWNTPSLYAKVGWYNNSALCCKSSGFLTFIIEGPKGTNYW